MRDSGAARRSAPRLPPRSASCQGGKIATGVSLLRPLETCDAHDPQPTTRIDQAAKSDSPWRGSTMQGIGAVRTILCKFDPRKALSNDPSPLDPTVINS